MRGGEEWSGVEWSGVGVGGGEGGVSVCDHGLTRGCEPRLTVPPPDGRAKLRRSWLKVSSLHHRTMMIPWCCECCDRDEEKELKMVEESGEKTE